MSTSDQASQSVGQESVGQEQEEKSPEELRRDIQQTREQLGDTVQALAEKTDVKTQAKRRITALQGTARQKRNQVKAKAKAATPESANAGAQQVAAAARTNPLPLAMGSALVVGFLLGRWKSN